MPRASYYWKNKDRCREESMAWQRANPDKHDASVQRHRAKYPERHHAHLQTTYAIRRGDLVQEPCACGEEKTQAHHDDYSKPLEVRWLCVDCHARHHNE